ncbi:MAG: DUF1016 N-terminal domain-containing protein [Bacteroidia bacterium]
MKPEKSNSLLQSLIDEIKILIIHSRQELGRTANRQLLNTYWQIGQVIVERENAQNLSARKLILDLSRELTKQLGKGFSRSNLFNMRLFYLKYSDVQTVSGHVSWSHVCELLSVEDNDARAFYEAEMMNSKWSVRELKRQIKQLIIQIFISIIRLSKRGANN